jgi:SAM-dependent methyltransferase
MLQQLRSERLDEIFVTVPEQAIATPNRRASLSPAALRYFDNVTKTSAWKRKMRTYVENNIHFLTKVVPANKRVLMVGCLTSEIIEALQPSFGVSLDVSERAVREAREKSTQSTIHYYRGLPEDFQFTGKFDYIIVLNYVDHSDDLMELVDSLRKFAHEDTCVVLSMLNPLWHRLVQAASRLRIRIPDFRRNLIAGRSLSTALEIKRFKVMEVCRRVLIPKKIPGISSWVNQFVARLPIFNSLCFMQYVIAKPANATVPGSSLSCSVIIPCYNEEGNIEECIRRVPKMGRFTEILVVNDGSKDGTLRVVEGLKTEFPNLTVVTYEKNRGKGNAVLEGMRRSKGDVMMILDADMTVPPEELTDFFEAIDSKTADFVSGTRFLYPMEREAMRFANFVGNIIFSKLVEIIVGSDCSDTLCGTKAMRKTDFADFKLEDSAWGDFDLIFHAARRKLKCVQVPVHYKSRVAGESKMKAFSSGVSFLKLCFRKWSELP